MFKEMRRKKQEKKILIFFTLLLLTLIPLLYHVTVSAEESSGFELTSQEQEYLASISDRSLKLAITSELMSFETKNGSFGLLKPLLNIVEDDWNLKIEIVNCGWSESFNQLNNGGVDLIGLAVLSEQRKQSYYYTEALYTSTMDVYTCISAPLINITNLDNSTIGLVRGSVLEQLLDQYIRTKTKVMYYDTIDEMFTALSENEIDCAISSLNAQSELMRHPDITCEMDVQTVLPSQGLYAKDEKLAPLMAIINRYLLSSAGDELLNDIDESRQESILEKAKEFYAEDIAYLNTNYTKLEVYDSGVLYPFHFMKDNEFTGIQEDTNKMFYSLTGMAITTLPAADFAEGFLTALEKIKTGEIIGATGVYYNKSYDLDDSYIYSDPVYQDQLGFYAKKELDSIYGLKIGATKFAAPYVDWQTVAGTEPTIYGDRGVMLQALRDGEIEAAFVSEMGVDFNYTILGDHTFVRAVPFEATANVHLIAGKDHEVFVKLFNAAYMLDKTLNKEKLLKWTDASRNDKYELIRVRNLVAGYQNRFIVTTVLIIIILVVSLIIIYFNYRKFNNYDRQIARMLSTQKNVDMLWGNTKTKRIISKGDFPILKSWGVELSEFEGAQSMYQTFEEELNGLESEKTEFCMSETSFTIPNENVKHYIRHYTHRITDHQFMVFALDTTDEKRREKKLSNLANTDSLSNLYTRRAMEIKLKNLINKKSGDLEALYILMFDIDNFKKVNDSYGHDVGDKVLIMVANILKEITSGLASRWGGEEFLLAVSAPSPETVLSMANEILKSISEKTITVDVTTSFSVTVSCGIAQINGADYDKAIINADKGLYTAKWEGKNCARYIEE